MNNLDKIVLVTTTNTFRDALQIAKPIIQEKEPLTGTTAAQIMGFCHYPVEDYEGVVSPETFHRLIGMKSAFNSTFGSLIKKEGAPLLLISSSPTSEPNRRP